MCWSNKQHCCGRRQEAALLFCSFYFTSALQIGLTVPLRLQKCPCSLFYGCFHLTNLSSSLLSLDDSCVSSQNHNSSMLTESLQSELHISLQSLSNACPGALTFPQVQCYSNPSHRFVKTILTGRRQALGRVPVKTTPPWLAKKIKARKDVWFQSSEHRGNSFRNEMKKRTQSSGSRKSNYSSQGARINTHRSCDFHTQDHFPVLGFSWTRNVEYAVNKVCSCTPTCHPEQHTEHRLCDRWCKRKNGWFWYL